MTTLFKLEPEIEHRLDLLAAQTGRAKIDYLQEIIEQGLEDLEDYYFTTEVYERVLHGQESVYSAATVRKELGLDN